MIYTVQLDLFINSDEIYSEEEIKECIEHQLNLTAIETKNIKLIEIND